MQRQLYTQGSAPSGTFEMLVLQTQELTEHFEPVGSDPFSDDHWTEIRDEDEMHAIETGKTIKRTRDGGRSLPATMLALHGLLPSGDNITLHVEDIRPCWFIELPEPIDRVNIPGEHKGAAGGKPWTERHLPLLKRGLQSALAAYKKRRDPPHITCTWLQASRMFMRDPDPKDLTKRRLRNYVMVEFDTQWDSRDLGKLLWASIPIPGAADHNLCGRCDDGTYSLLCCEARVPIYQQLCTRVGFVPSGWVKIEKHSPVMPSPSLSAYTLSTTDDYMDKGNDEQPYPPMRGVALDFEMQPGNGRSFPMEDRDRDYISVASFAFWWIFKRPEGARPLVGKNPIDRRVTLALQSIDPAKMQELAEAGPEVELEIFETPTDLRNRIRDLLVVEESVNVITGWNNRDFDLKFLFGKNIRDDEMIRGKYWSWYPTQLSHRHRKPLNRGGIGDIYTYQNMGPIIMDLYHYVRENKKLKSYKLDFVAKKMLKASKHDMPYEEMFDIVKERDPVKMARVAAYCQQDADLVVHLAEKLSAIPLLMEQCRVFRTPMQTRIDSGQGVRVMAQLVHTAHKMRMIVNEIDKQGFGYPGGKPPPRDGSKMQGDGDVQYEGATVIEPKKGFYDEPIATLDFASLYPSIMMAHNLCHSTLMSRCSPAQIAAHKAAEHVYTANPTPTETYHWDQSQIGVLPSLLKGILGQRKVAKFDMALAGAVADDFQALTPQQHSQLESIAVKMMSIKGTRDYDNGQARRAFSDVVKAEIEAGRAFEKAPASMDTNRAIADARIRLFDHLVEEARAQIAKGGKGVKFGELRLETLTDLGKDGLVACHTASEYTAWLQKKSVQNGRQLALKVSANSVYGFTGATVGQLVCDAIAKTVTYTGRNMINTCYKVAHSTTYEIGGHSIGFEVIYGDTDSIMVRGTGYPADATSEQKRQFLTIAANKLADKLTNDVFEKDCVVMEMEQVQDKFVSFKKKRYVAVMNGELYMKGIDTVRRDTFDIVGRLSEAFLEALLLREDEEEGLNLVCDTLADMVSNSLPLKDFVYSKGRGPKYDPANTTPAHMAVVYAAKRAKPGMEPQVGDRVEYVIGRQRDTTRLFDPDWDEKERAALQTAMDAEGDEPTSAPPPAKRRGRARVKPVKRGFGSAGVSTKTVKVATAKIAAEKRSAKPKKEDEGVAEKARSVAEMEAEPGNGLDMTYYLTKLQRPLNEISTYFQNASVMAMFSSALEMAVAYNMNSPVERTRARELLWLKAQGARGPPVYAK